MGRRLAFLGFPDGLARKDSMTHRRINLLKIIVVGKIAILV
jgi:hypothetical protein